MARDEILRAATTLGLGPDAFREVEGAAGDDVVRQALATFVRSGDRVWWWEDFSLPSEAWCAPDSLGFRRLLQVVPHPHERVWFIAEDDTLPRYPVFEASVSVVVDVLSECFAFEYYSVSQRFDWLVCENHHDEIFGVGAPVMERVARLASDDPSKDTGGS